MAFCPAGDAMVNPIVKYVCFIGIYLQWICCVAMVTLGPWIMKMFYAIFEIQCEAVLILGIVTIVTGGIILIISICGFLGALRERITLLRIFYISMTALLLLEIIGLTLVVLLSDRILAGCSEDLKGEYIANYMYHIEVVNETHCIVIEGVIDTIQRNVLSIFKCCGIDGHLDYDDANNFTCVPEFLSILRCDVPFTCSKDLTNVTSSTSLDLTWTKGCVPVVIDYIKDKTIPFVIFVLVAQLIGVVTGCVITCQIDVKWTEQYWKCQKRGEQQQRQQTRGRSYHDNTSYQIDGKWKEQYWKRQKRGEQQQRQQTRGRSYHDNTSYRK